VKLTPRLLRASRGRKANPRKVKLVCSCFPRRLLVAVGTALRPCGLGPPPAQIPACAANALGSSLGFERRSGRLAMGV
jgi:hypothetical protein